MAFALRGIEGRVSVTYSVNDRPDLDWLAHSFLCVPDGGGDARLEAQALLGFSWGFRIRDEVIALVPPVSLEPSAWDHDAALLAPLYPGWRFVEGFRAD